LLLEISTNFEPATDLGFLLHKHPDKFQSVKLSHGQAHVFYSEATNEKATICLLLDIDPISLVKGVRNLSGKGFALGHYVNDRPYVSSSFMSVAIVKAFSTALNGKCTNKPELVDVEIPFEVKISVVSAPKGGALLIRKLFEPLGYELTIERHQLDEKFEAWGDSKYYTVQLKNKIKTKDLLSHLYVLLPVLDNDKHYYVSENEIDKLVSKGEGWLEDHPERSQIINRYLLHFKSLSKKATDRFLVDDGDTDEAKEHLTEKKKVETLHSKRLKMVLEKLEESGAERVLDLGCGEGKLLKMLLKKKQFKKIVGMDISYSELNRAKDKLYWDEMSPKQKERITLFQGALTYRDKRMEGFDAAALVEVIEHLEEDRLEAMERVVFELAKPLTVIVTTPNKEYNVLFENMSEEQMRHDDHRFEWTRAEFEKWGSKVATKNNYFVDFLPIGDEEQDVGAPSQMAIFRYGN